MTRHVILVHGVFSSGENSVGELTPLLKEKGVEPVPYKYFPNDLLAARLLNGKRSRDVADIAWRTPANAAVGHSNGCAILHEAARKQAGLHRLIYVNPALDSNPKPLPDDVERVYVLHAPDDMATWFAKFLFMSPWGDMGRKGYQGDDNRWINLNVGTGTVWSPWRRKNGFRDTSVLNFRPDESAHGHSGVWYEAYWVNLIAELAVGQLVIG